MSGELKYDLDKLVGGVPKRLALALFQNACNRCDTLFAPDSWLPSRLQQLTTLLSDPVTGDQAAAIRAAVVRRAKLDDVIDWLKNQSLPWLRFRRDRERLRTADQERILGAPYEYYVIVSGGGHPPSPSAELPELEAAVYLGLRGWECSVHFDNREDAVRFEQRLVEAGFEETRIKPMGPLPVK